MKRTVKLLSLLLSLLWFQNVCGQNQVDQKFDQLFSLFCEMEKDGALRVDSIYIQKFSQSIAESLNSVKESGTSRQKALMAFMRYEELGWTNSTDVYSRILVGNEIWNLREALPEERKLIAYDRLLTLFQSTEQQVDMLNVALEKCRILNGDSIENCLELGSVYHNLKQYDKAIGFYRLSVKELQRQNDPFMVGVYTNNIGLAHRELNRKDSARICFEKTLKIFSGMDSSATSFDQAYVQHFKNLVEWNLHQMEDGISSRQLQLARELIASGRKYIEWHWVINGFELLAKHEYNQRQFEIARQHIDSAIAQAKVFHSPQREIDLLQLKGKTLIGNGQLKKSDEIFQRARQMADSLKLIDADLKANIAAAEYREKERKLELGKSQQLAYDERKQRVNTTALLVGAIIILLLVVVFYFKSRKSAKVISTQKEKLAASLAEKEVLLKEIHHRVKNNLQVVSNMLDLGTFTETDPKLLATLTEAKDRIKTMALIHTNLYQHDDLSAIKFEGYLNDLLRGLADTYFNRGKKITWQLEAGEDLLDIDTAVPVGLIVNELVSNAYKYAFLEKEEGLISVEFRKENDTFHLTVKDDGPGLPPDFDPTKSKSLGLRIVQILVRQLEGKMNILRNDGTQFHITFKPLDQRRVESR